ncbi:hypothetical protein LCGC14_1734470 [marine sediment metagenome]|uniref:Calcineurin-like phosphoesterase domain-containing protein n=1 Tax=marine sediment metagenome TaxID=412755 RepID=A0A0F9H8E2_9ZZZZ
MPPNDEEFAIKKWAMIPDDTDILVTHGPPHGILDIPKPPAEVRKCGCKKLLSAVLRVKPKVHIFGHIHGGYGRVEQDGIQFINASVCTELYQPINVAQIIEI